LWLSAAGTAALLRVVARRGRGWLVVAGVSAALVAGLSATSSPSLFARTRHGDYALRAMAAGMLDAAPADAIVVVESDHWAASILWLQEAEARREDVVVIPWGLGSSSWYWEHLFARHPELAATPLTGPGGKVGRLARLLRGNPGRALLLERPSLADETQIPFCDVGWVLRAGTRCAAEPHVTRSATRTLAALAEHPGAGSPALDEVVARVSLERGEGLWRLGRGKEAYAALAAGVPRSLAPTAPPPDWGALHVAPPLRGRLPAWRDAAALGDPRRNCYLLSELMRASGDGETRAYWLGVARDAGLPEALAAPR
jgi:hypothetical protein